MRKIKIIEQISLDGVIQAPADETKTATTRMADGRCHISIRTLVSTKAASSGVLMKTYRPVGSLRTESFADASG